MKFERHIWAGAVLALVIGCTPTSSIRTAGDTQALNIRSVTVDTSQMTQAVTGRTSNVTVSQLDADLTAAIRASVAQASDPNGTPADLSVRVSALMLAPPASRAVGNGSSIKGVIKVTEQKTGRVIVPATELTGFSKSLRAVGAIGLATTQTVEKDYRATLSGYAETVRVALFGSDK